MEDLFLKRCISHIRQKRDKVLEMRVSIFEPK